MKACQNKECRRAGQLLSDDQFNRDKTKPDGLQRICRECNALKCRRWYAEDPDQHRADMLNRKKGRVENPASGRKPRVSPINLSEIEEREREYHMLKFHPREWRFLTEAAAELKMSVEQYLITIVRDEKAKRN
jgi:hypothetical protein